MHAAPIAGGWAEARGAGAAAARDERLRAVPNPGAAVPGARAAAVGSAGTPECVGTGSGRAATGEGVSEAGVIASDLRRFA